MSLLSSLLARLLARLNPSVARGSQSNLSSVVSSAGLEKVWLDEVRDATEGDRQILTTLRSAGADLSQARHQRHFFHFPTVDGARFARERLTTHGFQSRTEKESIQPPSWLVVAEKVAVVDENVAMGYRQDLTALATDLGGRYEGWEAAVEP
jgi:hypothetical protein